MASIAGGEARAVVDGNVIRVLARLLRLTENPKSSQGSKLYASLAQTLLDTSRPGDFNQVLPLAYPPSCLSIMSILAVLFVYTVLLCVQYFCVYSIFVCTVIFM